MASIDRLAGGGGGGGSFLTRRFTMRAAGDSVEAAVRGVAGATADAAATSSVGSLPTFRAVYSCHDTATCQEISQIASNSTIFFILYSMIILFIFIDKLWE